VIFVDRVSVFFENYGAEGEHCCCNYGTVSTQPRRESRHRYEVGKIFGVREQCAREQL
jgi:hypothetical protein